MEYNFTGSLTQRNINLGSIHEISSAQLAQQARQERAARQEIRARHTAATQIQSFYRGRASTHAARQTYRQIARRLLDAVEQSAGPSRLPDFLQLTKYVAAATSRQLQERKRRHAAWNEADVLTRAEAKAVVEDDEILLSWAVIATRPHDLESLLLQSLRSRAEDQVNCIKALARTTLLHLEVAPTSRRPSYGPLLALLTTLSTQGVVSVPADQRQTWLSFLIKAGLFQALRSHIKHASTAAAAATTAAAATALSLAPLSIAEGEGRSNYLDRFIADILTIPDLPNCIPRSALTQLAIQLPVLQVAERVVKGCRGIAEGASVHLLANFIALAWKRVPLLANGAELKVYVLALTKMQDSLPEGALRLSNVTGRSTANGEAGGLAVPTKNGVASGSAGAATANRLRTLCSPDHINALLAASARFPNSTREPLCAFLTSSLQSWDTDGRDKILSCIAYGQSAGASNRIQQHSIGGLVRELWRGWIRGSALARTLSHKSIESRKALTEVLTDVNLQASWPCLFVLCQLYSRSLLTIGDDEFYPDDSRSTNSNQTASSIRNPLSLDEIVSLSGILRNLAFAMYWFEGAGGMMNDLSNHHVLGSEKLDLLSLRNVVTQLLQQLQQRDSRRRFAPEGHWLMTTELDLNGFIQSVVMEEEELSRQDVQPAELTDGMDVDDDEQERDEGTIEGVEGRRSTGPAISSRLANHRRAGVRDRALTARNLAYLSPRLGVLNNIPFVIPFEVRVEIFHQFTALDYVRLRKQRQMHGPLREITIRRGSVAEDGFKMLNGLGESLKHRFAIKFVDQFGIEESGIDGGGLFKEFLTSLIKEAFDTDRGLWSATSDQQLYPNPHSYARQEENLQWYRFLGRILGKALYQGILVDINFASFFLSKWLGKGHGYLDDLSGLESMDKEVYKNLLWLKHYSGDVEKDLALDFTVIDEEFGQKRVHELIPNGRNVPVTRENRLEYIYRVSHYRLNEQIRLQSEAFMSGLTDLIDLRWLRMLNREEVRILISGTEGDIDLDDLRANTVLGGYHEKDQVVDFFWTALASFTHDQRKAFLKFATSCPSPPLLGFAQLNPKFGIRHAGEDTDRLPTASTCVNLLKLPRYTTYEQCREKLLYAIESGAGFDLS